MIIIRYRGGMGNKFFVYCYGRILAEQFKYALCCGKIPGFSNIQPIDGFKCNHNAVKIYFNNATQIFKDLNDNKHHKIILKYSMQEYYLYKNHKEKIKHWLKPDLEFDKNNISHLDFRVKKNNIFEKTIIENIGSEDVILVQRLKNFVDLRVDIKFNYFETILNNINFKRLFIISDEFESEMFNKFSKYNPIYLFGDPLTHYSFPMLFDKMIISQSTFCWWIAWMSNAKEIYFPLTANGYWSERWMTYNCVNLIVDEDRYHMVREIPKESEFVFEDKNKVLKSIVVKDRTHRKIGHPEW